MKNISKTPQMISVVIISLMVAGFACWVIVFPKDIEIRVDNLIYQKNIEIEIYTTVEKRGSYLPKGSRVKDCYDVFVGYMYDGDGNIYGEMYDTEYLYEIEEWIPGGTFSTEGVKGEKIKWPHIKHLIDENSIPTIGSRRVKKKEIKYYIISNNIRYNTTESFFEQISIGDNIEATFHPIFNSIQ